MRDRAAERPGCRPLGVDVDPLPVAGGVGEQVDLMLGDRTPPGVAQVLADRRAEPVNTVEKLS